LSKRRTIVLVHRSSIQYLPNTTREGFGVAIVVFLFLRLTGDVYYRENSTLILIFHVEDSFKRFRSSTKTTNIRREEKTIDVRSTLTMMNSPLMSMRYCIQSTFCSRTMLTTTTTTFLSRTTQQRQRIDTLTVTQIAAHRQSQQQRHLLQVRNSSFSTLAPNYHLNCSQIVASEQPPAPQQQPLLQHPQQLQLQSQTVHHRYYSVSTKHTMAATASFSTASAKAKTLFQKKKSKKQIIAKLMEKEYNSAYNKEKTVFLKLCYTDHDLEEGDIVKAKFHWDSIVAVTTEEFGISTSTGTDGSALEYNNGEDWIKLLPYRLYEVLQFFPCTRRAPLPVRIPKLYDEEYGTRNDAVKMRKVTPEMRKKQLDFVRSGPSASQWLMKETIEGIVKRCKADGYTRSSLATINDPLLSFQYRDTEGNVVTITQSTRDYVLDLARNHALWTIPTPREEAELEKQRYAAQGINRPGSKQNPLNIHTGMPHNKGGGNGGEDDPNNPDAQPDPDQVLKKLKHVLLSQPNALQHITECLHYDHVW
jgi:hypothetical protein